MQIGWSLSSKRPFLPFVSEPKTQWVACTLCTKSLLQRKHISFHWVHPLTYPLLLHLCFPKPLRLCPSFSLDQGLQPGHLRLGCQQCAANVSHVLRCLPRKLASREKLYTPPPSPHFWLEGILGLCFEAPRRALSGAGRLGVFKLCLALHAAGARFWGPSCFRAMRL